MIKFTSLHVSPVNIIKYLLPPSITLVIFLAWFTNFNLGLDEILEGDGGINLLIITAAVREVFPFLIESVGAPLTFHMADFPIYNDFFPLLAIKLVSFFSANPAVAILFLYVLSFPLATLTMMLALRLVSNPPYLITALISLLYAFIPFHYLRLGHFFYTLDIYILPLSAAVLILVYQGKVQLFNQLGGLNLKSKLLWLTTAITVLQAGSGLYFTFFYCLFLCCIFLAKYFEAPAQPQLKKQQLYTISYFIAVAFGITLLLTLPTIMYGLQHGSMLTHRSYLNLELFGLKIVQLFMPISNHIISAFGHAHMKYASMPLVTENAISSLGVVLSLVVLFALLYSIIIAPLVKKSTLYLSETSKLLCMLIVFAIIYATIGGLASVLGQFGFTAIRATNRISMWIATLATFLLASFFTYMYAKYKTSHTCTFKLPYLSTVYAVNLKAVFLSILFVLLMILATLDIIGNRGGGLLVSKQVRVENNYLKSFITQIENQLETEDMVLQLPFVCFPETPPIHKMPHYPHVSSYIFNTGKKLRWSYPAMHKRTACLINTQLNSMHNAADKLVVFSKMFGYAGIYIDRFGYKDSGVDIVKRLTQYTGKKPIEAANNRYLFFKIKDLQQINAIKVTPIEGSLIHTIKLVPPVDWSRVVVQVEEVLDYFPAPCITNHTQVIAELKQHGIFRVQNCDLKKSGKDMPYFLKMSKIKLRQFVLPQKETLHPLSFNKTINFNTANADILKTDGFSGVESWGRWTNSPKASLAFRAPKAVCIKCQVILNAIAFIRSKNPQVSAMVKLNDTVIGDLEFIYGQENSAIHKFNIPAGLIKENAINLIEFVISGFNSPQRIGESNDTRPLGLGVKSLQIGNK